MNKDKKKMLQYMNKVSKRHLKHALIAALLLVANFALAQNDPQYVIKKGDNYMGHNGSGVVDVTQFDPDACLWYSSNNYNYYFMDGSVQKYLKAPLQPNGAITVESNPGTQMLNNNTHDFFFYDWDGGLARGIQHFGDSCPSIYHSNGSECWEVVWVSYVSSQWKMDSVYQYNPTINAARFYRVNVTEHAADTTTLSGGLTPLQGFEMNVGDVKNLSASVANYQYSALPAYTTYVFDGGTHNYYGGTDHQGTIPNAVTSTNNLASEATYAWSISGVGATYLTLTNGNTATPKLTYNNPNNTGHKQATLTVTVTYGDGSKQTSSATVLVKTPCQNPTVLAGQEGITFVGVTVSWVPTAEQYKVFWKKHDVSVWNDSVTLGNVTSYTITGLEYESTYDYKVRAIPCGEDPSNVNSFTTLEEPGLMVMGAIFGGGRMAAVGGNTEVVVVNCDSIGMIFGGNDIADTVQGNAGSTIMLGVSAAPYNTYGTTTGSIKVGSVYGGGNGYYAYNGSSFAPAASHTCTVPAGASVTELSSTHEWNEPVWTNSGSDVTLALPHIKTANITVDNDHVKVDSIFGGAKNAYLYTSAGSSITINGGTVFAVFGGNNVGGGQGYGWHNVTVNSTITNLAANIENTASSGYGRDFGIRYLFGGGNMVYGSTTNVVINGGQCDTIFAGGNSADVYAANLTVNCEIASGSETTWGALYSNAIDTYSSSGVITPKTDYDWDGINGIYNVRTLFGGNNQATFDSELNKKVPNIVLKSGSIGTVYGGGNAGDMWGLVTDDGNGGNLTINDDIVKYGTHVVMNSDSILVDNLYGGCQVSNVRYSTWVEIKKGHVGTVFGGCNVSGDVGSTRIDLDAPQWISEGVPNEDYQKVFGGTYVVVSGGTVYKNVFAGGNGFYHCLNDNGFYTGTLSYTENDYVGLSAPTHNETHVVFTGGTVKGNVYAGGNLACVGFDNEKINNNPNHGSFPKFVGLSSVRMSGGTVNGSVYGGGNMADVYGSNEVQVSGGTIDKSLYGGNDRMGKVAQISNRVLPASYNTASDSVTSLLDPKVYTYVSLTGNPSITNVYGGGNGDYEYFTSFAAAEDYVSGGGEKETVVSCDNSNQPIQRCTFVDVGIDGGVSGGHIGTVYGGGDGVTVTEFLKVFLNVKTNPIGVSNVGTIFGGNNKGDLELVSDIILLNGQVNTVYGGCNQGAMTGTKNLDATYTNVGSYVRLLDSYDADGPNHDTVPVVTPNIKVMDAIYGGCRMNGVSNNSLVLLEGGNFRGTKLYGGSDISGTVSGSSRVVVAGGQCDTVFGGGNGYYTYNNDGNVYTIPTSGDPVLVATGIESAPICAQSGVDILGGQVGASETGNEGNIFGGGYGAKTKTTGNVVVNLGPATATTWTGLPVMYGNIYGGSALGSVNTNANNTTTVNVLNGTLHGNVFGGGLGHADYDTCGKVNGKVFVNISNDSQPAANCFIDLRDANVFGCNNTNGSPQDSVTVNVYKTAYNFIDYTSGGNYTAANGADPYYAIANVFGGGNMANYLPENGNTNSTKVATVNVFDCGNTIGHVYSGGNQAAATGVATNIYGGRFNQVFGGGNGDGGAANIGNGGTNLMVSGGKILQLFGGSNLQGTIDGPMRVNVTNSGSCAEDITEFFGGSNQADMGSSEHPVNLVTTIGCNTTPVQITNVYGGSNLASIIGNVKVNIEGGIYTNVYAGSKGSNSKAADITGTTTLNLYGGTIANAFGGSNVNGNITGQITVNVLDYENCDLNVANVYGASNQTAYAPTNSALASPAVNVMHVKQAAGITGNVFGGGNQGAVTANPVVNIGYTSSLSSQIPTGYAIAEANRRAYVSGSVYGGGNEAGVTAPTVNINSGIVATDVYGGCNTQGTVTGDIVVNANGGTVGQDVFGGGKGYQTETEGGILVSVDGATVTRNVYGGSALGQVNDDAADLTKVWLKSGTVTGNLFGGGMGQIEEPTYGQVNGQVEVHVNGGIVNNVFGCNNLNGQPKSTVKVYVNETTANTMAIGGNVYGGGNEAYYEGTPEVHVQHGTIANKVFGGGNNITVTNKGVGGGNVQMSGGTVLGGIYGGCNTQGTVTGNVTVTLTGGTVGATGTGNEGSIHGGGYGQQTTVAGNVTVNFGELAFDAVSGDEIHNDEPILYGDLYGGSALGNVNTDANNTTTVNILNGLVEGNVFGGGLGDIANNIKASVNGKVEVNIGAVEITNQGTASEVVTLKGMASFNDGYVYGCNNQNGSPQDTVLVNIYKTNHTVQDSASYLGTDATYAILNVFGGGNLANYEPVGYDNGYTSFTPNGAHRTCVYIHGCDNTIRNVYGGGNAADAFGVSLIVEGGRFNEVFGGGNGLVSAANIGMGGIGILKESGHVNYFFEGSNRLGTNFADSVYVVPTPTSGTIACSGEFIVDSYFCGANMAEIIEGVKRTILCDDRWHYKYLYAGSRWATIYGDVEITVEGGYFENVFGGSRGYNEAIGSVSADIKKYPTYQQIVDDTVSNTYQYSARLRKFILDNPTLGGTGGNIKVIIKGGTIGNLYGGCDVLGNVEGKISITVEQDPTFASCPLFVGNVYGASNMTFYSPTDGNTLVSPEVKILKATIGGTTSEFGTTKTYEGNVFGGGNLGDVTSNPKVIIGEKTNTNPVTIEGNVFGGGNEGNVNGSPQVIIVPTE